VVSDATIYIVLILWIMANWYAEVTDVRGAFLHGEFEPRQQLFVYAPQGFEYYYKPNVVLMLMKTIYGLKQSAYAFWLKLFAAFKLMNFTRSKADPYLYFQWTTLESVLWISWVDDCLVMGKKEAVLNAKKGLLQQFDCDESGELTDYVGCKIDRNEAEGWAEITQPVLLQSLGDEFDLPDGEYPDTPAVPGSILMKGLPDNNVSNDEQTTYRSRTGKLLHMMKRSRPDILNSVRELSRFMTRANESHMTSMYRLLKYCVGTPIWCAFLKPDIVCDGSADFEFVVHERSDSDFAKDEGCRSVAGYSTFLCGAAVTNKSKMQDLVTLSVTESELVAATLCVQDMMFIMRILIVGPKGPETDGFGGRQQRCCQYYQ
jgi:hypothetical protein